MSEPCQYCGYYLLEPVGPVRSDILLVGTAPDWKDIKNGVPFSGDAGNVIKEELQRAAIIPGRCRMTNLWLHAKNPKDCEIDFHVTSLFKELSGKKFVLIMGTDVLNLFLPNDTISDWTGLEIKSIDLPKGAQAIAMYNPSTALSDTLGETRFAIENFAELVHG